MILFIVKKEKEGKTITSLHPHCPLAPLAAAPHLSRHCPECRLVPRSICTLHLYDAAASPWGRLWATREGGRTVLTAYAEAQSSRHHVCVKQIRGSSGRAGVSIVVSCFHPFCLLVANGCRCCRAERGVGGWNLHLCTISTAMFGCRRRSLGRGSRQQRPQRHSLVCTGYLWVFVRLFWTLSSFVFFSSSLLFKEGERSGVSYLY